MVLDLSGRQNQTILNRQDKPELLLKLRNELYNNFLTVLNFNILSLFLKNSMTIHLKIKFHQVTPSTVKVTDLAPNFLSLIQ